MRAGGHSLYSHLNPLTPPTSIFALIVFNKPTTSPRGIYRLYLYPFISVPFLPYFRSLHLLPFTQSLRYIPSHIIFTRSITLLLPLLQLILLHYHYNRDTNSISRDVFRKISPLLAKLRRLERQAPLNLRLHIGSIRGRSILRIG